MAESNPAENNRSFIPRNEFLTIVANASKGAASVKYGRAFLGSKYTLRLELDGKLDDQTLVRVYYIRGDRKVAMTEAYSGQLLDFTTEATYKAFELGSPSKSLCCEIFVYGNEAVIAHGMMTVEWSPSIAVDGYGRGVDVQGQPGVPYIPGKYYTVVNYGDMDCSGHVSSWTDIYQTMIHPTTGETVCIQMPYTLEDLKGEKGDKGDTGEGLTDVDVVIENAGNENYSENFNAQLFSSGELISSCPFTVHTGIYDARLDLCGADASGLHFSFYRDFYPSRTIVDSVSVPFDVRAWKSTSKDIEGNVTCYNEYIAVDVNNYGYVADVSTLFGLLNACMHISTIGCGSSVLNLALTEVSGEVFCSSVLLPDATGSSGNWRNSSLSIDTNDNYFLLALSQYCGSSDMSNTVTASIPWATLSSYISSGGGSVTPTGQYVSSIDYCLVTGGDSFASTGYIEVYYSNESTPQYIPYGYGSGGSGGGGICAIQAVKNSSGYVTDVIYRLADGSSFCA